MIPLLLTEKQANCVDEHCIEAAKELSGLVYLSKVTGLIALPHRSAFESQLRLCFHLPVTVGEGFLKQPGFHPMITLACPGVNLTVC